MQQLAVTSQYRFVAKEHLEVGAAIQVNLIVDVMQVNLDRSRANL